MPRMKHQDLLVGLIRLHILHHASKEEFYGQWMIHELASHGYTLSPGTLYPMLHALERRGYLKSRKERQGRTYRRLYRATALGREADRICKVQVRELTGQGRKKGQGNREPQGPEPEADLTSGPEQRRNTPSYGRAANISRDRPGGKL
jgi:PadR family transcriptional regulator, regulatory protein PadR